MSEQKESSVLFSLKELMSLEEDRIKTEEADKAAAAAAAEHARLEAERAAREAEEARIRSEAERRRLDEQRAREEAAKLDAIRHAEIEKARLEAEQRARLEAMEAQQKHERSLAAISQDASKKKLRNALIGGGVFAALIIGIGGYVAVDNSNKAAARAQAEALERQRLEDEQKKLKAALDDQQKKTDSLIAQLSSAKDDAERARLQKQLAEEQAKTDSLKKSGPVTGGGGPRPDAPAAPKKKCTPGDPLCTDI